VTEAWESSVAVGKDPVASDPTIEPSVVDGSAVELPGWAVEGASVSDPTEIPSVVVVEGSLVEVASSGITPESVAAEGDSVETAEGAEVVSSGAADSGVVSG
jgi:hypothetical protein